MEFIWCSILYTRSKIPTTVTQVVFENSLFNSLMLTLSTALHTSGWPYCCLIIVDIDFFFQLHPSLTFERFSAVEGADFNGEPLTIINEPNLSSFAVLNNISGVYLTTTA